MAPGAYSETNAPPPPTIRSARPWFCEGYTGASIGVGSTAIVFPSARSAPSCPTVSQPKASPLTITYSSAARTSASLVPILFPKSVGSRVPIMATAFSALSTAASPLQNRIGGYLLLRSKRRGYALI